jgi:hypothetical protein
MNNSKNYAQIEIRLIIGLMLFVVLGNGLVCVGGADTDNIVQWNGIHSGSPNSVDNVPYNLAVNDPGYGAEGLLLLPKTYNVSSALHIWAAAGKTIKVEQVNSFTSAVTWNTKPTVIRTLVASKVVTTGWNIIYLPGGDNITYIHLVGNGGSCCINMLSGHTAYIETLNQSIYTVLSNDSYVQDNVSITCVGCANANYGTLGYLLAGWWNLGTAYTYIDLGSTYNNNNAVNLNLYGYTSSGNVSFEIYSTSYFNASNITYNNRPAAISLLTTIQTNTPFGAEVGWIPINISSLSRYIIITTTNASQSIGFDSSEYATEFLRPYIRSIYIAPTIFDPSGYVNDNLGNPIQNSDITFWNVTFSILTTSDSSGYYNLSGKMADGFYDFVAMKDGHGQAQGYGTITNGGISKINFTLYSGDPCTAGFVCGLVGRYTFVANSTFYVNPQFGFTAMSNVTVNLWNGSYSASNNSLSWGYYQIPINTDGNYSITANKSSYVTRGIDTVTVTNNSALKYLFLVCLGDLNIDNWVNVNDFVLFGAYYNINITNPYYYYLADLNNDTKISNSDFTLFATKYKTQCTEN